MSQPQPSSPLISGAMHGVRSSLAAFSIAAGLLFAPLTQAAVVYNPASIVDHGDYITDTVNHLDWYKFTSPLSTIGWARDDWMATYSAWSDYSIASLDQVHELQSQFGWTADTLDFNTNANFGLTEAMAAYLGFTAVDSFFNGDTTLWRFMIQAMTSETYYFWDDLTQDYTDEHLQVTLSQMDQFQDLHLQFSAPFGDFVYGASDYQRVTDANPLTGIWLTRASVDGGGAVGDCGRTAPCPPIDVPEPTSGALLMFGLVVLGTLRRTRYAKVSRK